MSIFTAEKPKLAQGVEKFVDALSGPPTYTLTPEEARATLEKAQSGNIVKPDVEIRDIVLKVGPTGQVRTRIIRPKGARAKLPCIFYVHGAGWVMGSPCTHDRMVRELAVGVGAAVIFPDYTRSPEAQYPTALEESYAVFEYAARHPEEFGIDEDGFIISGDSVGGNMATVLAMMSQERGGPKIIFQLLFYPVTDGTFETKSYNEFADGPWLTKKAMKWFWDAYLPDTERRKEKYASPLRASLADLAKMPPALILTDENDVLRDEGEAYARRLDEAGVYAANVRINGTIHDFAMLDGLADTAPTRTAMCLAIAEAKKYFQTIFPES